MTGGNYDIASLRVRTGLLIFSGIARFLIAFYVINLPVVVIIPCVNAMNIDNN